MRNGLVLKGKVSGRDPESGQIGHREFVRSKCNMCQLDRMGGKIAASLSLGRARKCAALDVDGFPMMHRGNQMPVNLSLPHGRQFRRLIAAKGAPFVAPFPTCLRNPEFTLYSAHP